MARCNVLVAVVVMLAVAGLQQQRCDAGLVDDVVSGVTSIVLKNACDQTVTILDVVGEVLAVVAPGTEVTVTTVEGKLATLVLANGRKAGVPLSVGHRRRRLRADNGDLTFNYSAVIYTSSITVTGTDTSGYNADYVNVTGTSTYTGTISFVAD